MSSASGIFEAAPPAPLPSPLPLARERGYGAQPVEPEEPEVEARSRALPRSRDLPIGTVQELGISEGSIPRAGHRAGYPAQVGKRPWQGALRTSTRAGILARP